jgi:hypothetical protein
MKHWYPHTGLHGVTKQKNELSVETRSTRLKRNGSLRSFREMGWDGTDWVDLAQDRDQWRALVNTVMNLWVP